MRKAAGFALWALALQPLIFSNYLKYMGFSVTTMPTIFGYFSGVSCCEDSGKYLSRERGVLTTFSAWFGVEGRAANGWMRRIGQFA